MFLMATRKAGMFDGITVLGAVGAGVLYIALSASFFPEGLMRAVGLLLPDSSEEFVGKLRLGQFAK
jgi:hypothetical protein